ncbi:teichoic acid D-Ala incorporation-associated protein DltX [Vagococcus carniphilus]|uniref:Teichoic acid D-Ala incorporation-associated protein DltX n=1 Tax=Vagococcus carniphilus TaxID=218144 RepID=A0AAW8U1P3_9ENTE|nr:teichoic acid D-Ala incorporation-associated protein DltX [Vagococcus carniphilus]MDT2832994.1 teichoic acid D-Ala incorporation-associated protein DltX [Vagococcus carniphilus]
MNKKQKRIMIFILKTVLYVLILLGLIYFYGYLKSGGGGFIYNEF